MNFFKKLFVGLGWATGFFCYTMAVIIVSASKGRHKRRKSRRSRNSGFWKTLERMMIYNWFCEGMHKSRTRVATAYSRRTGQSLWQEQKQRTVSGTKSNPPAWSARKTATTSTASSARKAAPVAPAQNRTPKTAGTPKREKTPESCHPRTAEQPALDQLRAERIRQQATYQGAPFADVFPVSLILADEDSERACIVDVGETGMSYVIPWSGIPAELREILKRYVSEAGGKLLGYCKEELCNSSANRMIVELYLGKQEEMTSRILF